jgi:hypothetical protein
MDPHDSHLAISEPGGTLRLGCRGNLRILASIQHDEIVAEAVHLLERNIPAIKEAPILFQA